MNPAAAGFDFSQFVPGFDFLQRMAQPGQASAGSPMPPWMAPTADPQEVERRIQDLKTVLFWLEQNSTALKATIQALEVQKLTLQTLQHMQTHMGDMAQAAQAMQQAAWAVPTTAAAASATAADPAAAAHADTPPPAAGEATPDAPTAMDQAMNQASQWWSSMFQTFQGIARQAQQDVQQQQAAFMQAAATAATGAATPQTAATPESAAPEPARAHDSVPTPAADGASAASSTSGSVQDKG